MVVKAFSASRRVGHKTPKVTCLSQPVAEVQVADPDYGDDAGVDPFGAQC